MDSDLRRNRILVGHIYVNDRKNIQGNAQFLPAESDETHLRIYPKVDIGTCCVDAGMRMRIALSAVNNDTCQHLQLDQIN